MICGSTETRGSQSFLIRTFRASARLVGFETHAQDSSVRWLRLIRAATPASWGLILNTQQ